MVVVQAGLRVAALAVGLDTATAVAPAPAAARERAVHMATAPVPAAGARAEPAVVGLAGTAAVPGAVEPEVAAGLVLVMAASTEAEQTVTSRSRTWWSAVAPVLRGPTANFLAQERMPKVVGHRRVAATNAARNQEIADAARRRCPVSPGLLHRLPDLLLTSLAPAVHLHPAHRVGASLCDTGGERVRCPSPLTSWSCSE